MPKNLGILLSGRGSNFEAIYKAIQQKKLDANLACVISNKADAKGLETAKSYSLPTYAFTQKDFDSKEAFEYSIITTLKKHACDLIILAGYMTLVGKPLLNAYPNRILNIHPSLLPAFKGLHAQKQALDYGVKIAGCTVHLVNEEVDSGKILAQSSVEVLEDDSEESLSNRILEKEHALYPKTIQRFLQKI